MSNIKFGFSLERPWSFHYNTARGPHGRVSGGFTCHEYIEERVKKIVVEQLGVKEDEVTNAASFVDDLGADSLDTVELVMALEEEFECEIPDEEAEKITTVQQAIDYINHTRADFLPETKAATTYVVAAFFFWLPVIGYALRGVSGVSSGVKGVNGV